jgi:hypothetical protein
MAQAAVPISNIRSPFLVRLVHTTLPGEDQADGRLAWWKQIGMHRFSDCLWSVFVSFISTRLRGSRPSAF